MKPRFSQLIIFCGDVRLLADFYITKLGLELVGDIDPEWTVLRAGDFVIGLHQIGTNYKPDESVGNNTKMVFEIDGDIHHTRQELIDQGVEMREVKDFESVPYLLCDGIDPEGNVFQLIAKRQ